MPQRLSQRRHFAFFEGGGGSFRNDFLRLFPWIYTCCQDKEEGGMEACNVGIKLTLTSLQFASPPLTLMRAYTLARSAHPGTRRCRAKNGALLRLTQCGVAEISCNKNVIGKIPIKMCEERGKSRVAASYERMRRQTRGEGGRQQSLMEEKCWSTRDEGGIFSLLTTGYPATLWWKNKKTFWLLLPSLALLSFFQILFSFSTWQRSLKLLSFPNQKLFPDSLPLSYNYSSGPCFSLLFSGLLFQHGLFCAQGDITASMGQRLPSSYSEGQKSGLLSLVRTYLIPNSVTLQITRRPDVILWNTFAGT